MVQGPPLALAATNVAAIAAGTNAEHVMALTEVEIVLAFIAAINSADLEVLRALMSPDRRFVDSACGTVEGRAAGAAAWASFFESFSDYRNLFEAVEVTSPAKVAITSRSERSFEPLDRTPRWRATIEYDLVTERRVDDPVAGRNR